MGQILFFSLFLIFSLWFFISTSQFGSLEMDFSKILDLKD